jgi:hypothetical protein
LTAFDVDMHLDDPGAPILAPRGLDTPQSRAAGLRVAGGQASDWIEPQTGQTLARITPDGGPLTLTFRFDGMPGAYADTVFVPTRSRYTRAAASLLDEVAGIGTTPQDIACAVAQRFDYGHPEHRFYEGHDESLPALGCDRGTGSCVDINMYFLAALRAGGFTAAYVAGAFFPAEKGDWCRDGHCWVVTRTAAGIEEWDIAHHLKMGRRDIAPALNPRPGFRAALSHGLGLCGPGGGMIKLLSEPVTAEAPHRHIPARFIRLRHPGIAPGPVRPDMEQSKP